MRKTKTYIVTADNRDAGKHFVLRELPASQAEKWAARAFLGLARSGVQIPENIVEAGLAGIASVGLQALGGMSYELAEPLMDEMMTCVQIMPNPSKPEVVRALIEDDIEEVATRIQLRREVFALHVDFSKAAALLKPEAASASKTAAG